jgi:hypothetical protein
MLVIICAGNGRKQGKKGKKFSGLPMAVTIGKLTISLPMAVDES